MKRTGPLNAITDVTGVRVGHAQDNRFKTGTTVLIADGSNRASVHVMGGAPGTRETDLLSPENVVESVDALVLSGGSAFGLDACGGAQTALAAQDKGFAVGNARIPIVPGAILFDLMTGEQNDDPDLYRRLGREAVEAASETFEIGSVGAGTGCVTGGGPGPIFGLKGGLGTASTVLSNGAVVGALVAVNALGSPVGGSPPRFLAAPYEVDGEFGTLGYLQDPLSDLPIKFRSRPAEGVATTIGIVATDLPLTKMQAKRLAIAAHDGFARALWPSHLPLDGDLVFAISVGEQEQSTDLDTQIEASAAAASVMARAIARGVWAATPAPDDPFPTVRTLV